MPNAHHTYDVFISYARQDGLRRAVRLEEDLTAAGFTTWRDKRDLDPNQDFTAELERAIERSQRVICCVTPDVRRQGSFVRREIAYALALNKPVIPLIFADTLPPIHIINITREDFTNVRWNHALTALIARLNSVEADAQQTVTPPDDPYRTYLNALYKQIVSFLQQTVFSEITLTSAATPHAIEQQELRALPVAFWGLAGVDPDTAEQRMSSNFANLRSAFDYYKRRVLLLGEPGAGKTTTLFAFARDKVADRLQDPTLPLPIIAPIAAWDAEQQPPLADWLASLLPRFSSAEITQLIHAGTALLLLDGLDELGTEGDDATAHTTDPRVLFTRLLPPDTPTVITCRADDYAALGSKIALNGAITLQPLKEWQIRAYLHDLPALWAALEADTDLREVARTPLLLSLFTIAYRDSADEITQLRDLRDSPAALRDSIFEIYVQRSYEREARKHALPPHITLDLVHTVLGQIAMQIIRWSGHGQKIVPDDLRAAYPHADSDHFLAVVANLHLLVFDGTDYRFKHQFLRDYFALSHSTRVLGAPASAQTLEALKIQGVLGDDRALPIVIAATQSDNSETRQRAAKALGYLGHSDTLEALLAMLDDADQWVRHSAVKALGVLGDTRAVPPLIRIVRTLEPAMQLQIVADALGFLNDTRAVPTLLTLLQTGDHTTRKSAAQALGRLRDPLAVEPLIAALDDPTERVQQDAIIALGDIGDDRALEPLIALCRAGSSVTRRSAYDALGTLGDPRAVPVLIDALNDYASYIRPFAAQALERIGTPAARTATAAWRVTQRGTGV